MAKPYPDSAAALHIHTTDSWQTIPLRVGLGLQSLVAHTGGKVGADRGHCADAAQFQFAVSISFIYSIQLRSD